MTDLMQVLIDRFNALLAGIAGSPEPGPRRLRRPAADACRTRCPRSTRKTGATSCTRPRTASRRSRRRLDAALAELPSRARRRPWRPGDARSEGALPPADGGADVRRRAGAPVHAGHAGAPRRLARIRRRPRRGAAGGGRCGGPAPGDQAPRHSLAEVRGGGGAGASPRAARSGGAARGARALRSPGRRLAAPRLQPDDARRDAPLRGSGPRPAADDRVVERARAQVGGGDDRRGDRRARARGRGPGAPARVAAPARQAGAPLAGAALDDPCGRRPGAPPARRGAPLGAGAAAAQPRGRSGRRDAGRRLAPDRRRRRGARARRRGRDRRRPHLLGQSQPRGDADRGALGARGQGRRRAPALRHLLRQARLGGHRQRHRRRRTPPSAPATPPASPIPSPSRSRTGAPSTAPASSRPTTSPRSTCCSIPTAPSSRPGLTRRMRAGRRRSGGELEGEVDELNRRRCGRGARSTGSGSRRSCACRTPRGSTRRRATTTARTSPASSPATGGRRRAAASSRRTWSASRPDLRLYRPARARRRRARRRVRGDGGAAVRPPPERGARLHGGPRRQPEPLDPARRRQLRLRPHAGLRGVRAGGGGGRGGGRRRRQPGLPPLPHRRGRRGRRLQRVEHHRSRQRRGGDHGRRHPPLPPAHLRRELLLEPRPDRRRAPEARPRGARREDHRAAAGRRSSARRTAPAWPRRTSRAARRC